MLNPLIVKKNIEILVSCVVNILYTRISCMETNASKKYTFPKHHWKHGAPFFMWKFASKANITQGRVRGIGGIGCVCITFRETLDKKLNEEQHVSNTQWQWPLFGSRKPVEQGEQGSYKMTPTQTSCNIIHGKSPKKKKKNIKLLLHLHCLIPRKKWVAFNDHYRETRISKELSGLWLDFPSELYHEWTVKSCVQEVSNQSGQIIIFHKPIK